MMKTILILFLILVIIPTIILADLGQLPGFLVALYAFPVVDKVAHFMLYGILAFLLVFVVTANNKPKGLRSALWSCIALTVFIGIEEVSQIMLANRSADLVDFICSVLGVVVFGCVAWQLKRKKLSAHPDG